MVWNKYEPNIHSSPKKLEILLDVLSIPIILNENNNWKIPSKIKIKKIGKNNFHINEKNLMFWSIKTFKIINIRKNLKYNKDL